MSDRDERELREEKDGITRRDFLDGVAVSAAGLAAAAASPHLTGAEAMTPDTAAAEPLPPGYYPPTSHRYHRRARQRDPATRSRSTAAAPKPSTVHSTNGRPGHPRARPRRRRRLRLVIVGAGASGIAAAKWYQDRFGPDTKILLIDQLPDFGGHSHRNEFHVPDAANGGADVMRCATAARSTSTASAPGTSRAPADIPGSYGQPAVDLLDLAGVDFTSATPWQNGGAAGHPRLVRPRPAAALPRRRVRHRPRDPGPQRRAVRRPSRPRGRLVGVPRAHAVLGRGARRASCDVQTDERRTSSPTRPTAAHAAAEARYLTSITYKQYLVRPRRASTTRRSSASTGAARAACSAPAARPCPRPTAGSSGGPASPTASGSATPTTSISPGSAARRTRTRARPAARRARGRTATRRCCGSRSAS